jgi:hypothetical protein
MSVPQSFEFRPAYRPFGILMAVGAPIWWLVAECGGVVRLWGDDDPPYAMVKTAAGNVRVDAGDWVTRNPETGQLSVVRSTEVGI